MAVQEHALVHVIRDVLVVVRDLAHLVVPEVVRGSVTQHVPDNAQMDALQDVVRLIVLLSK